MNNIESRLRALERHTYGGRMSPAVSLIYPTESGWGLKFSLWDGKVGSGGRDIISTHDTLENAHCEYDRLLSQYHSKSDDHLIIIDI